MWKKRNVSVGKQQRARMDSELYTVVIAVRYTFLIMPIIQSSY